MLKTGWKWIAYRCYRDHNLQYISLVTVPDCSTYLNIVMNWKVQEENKNQNYKQKKYRDKKIESILNGKQ